ncbi:MAG: hypothetical protein V1913_14125 [Fibrobacterota bacterium]
MFSKQPLLLPLIAVAVLVLLFLFQKQQVKKSEILRAEAKAAMPQLFKVLDDPLEGEPKGEPFVCAADKVRYGVAYPLPVGIASGRIEFDLARFHQTVGDEQLFFAITADKNALCMPALLKGAALSLYMNMKNDSLYLKAGIGTVTWRLDKELALPIRFLVEWHNGAATLFVNGTARAEARYADSLPQAENRLLLGQAAAVSEPVGADFKALQVSLPKGR